VWGNYAQTEPANRASKWGAVRSTNTGGIREITPEKYHGADHPRFIRAGVACIHDIETVRADVAHENQQQRVWVPRLLATRAATVREND
jgi:hypothetical protein